MCVGISASSCSSNLEAGAEPGQEDTFEPAAVSHAPEEASGKPPREAPGGDDRSGAASQ